MGLINLFRFWLWLLSRGLFITLCKLVFTCRKKQKSYLVLDDASRLTRPLRIFSITTNGDAVGGVEQILLGVAAFADRSRWDLEFCTLTARGHVHEGIEKSGWPVHALGITGYAQGISQVRLFTCRHGASVLPVPAARSRTKCVSPSQEPNTRHPSCS